MSPTPRPPDASRIIEFSPEDVRPDRASVLQEQGIPAARAAGRVTEALYRTGLELLHRVARPVGILCPLGRQDFASVYRGAGRNEPRTPVGELLGRADDLALFAVTLGERVGAEIAARFGANGLALGWMLDALASAAADRLAGALAARYRQLLDQAGRAGPETAVLGYSPGYCGWDISGQRALFAYLRPERIGLSLTAGFVMRPLKSVSGVLIAAPRRMHDLATDYPFCSRCTARGCRARIRGLFSGQGAGPG